jgi:hypothetical protein
MDATTHLPSRVVELQEPCGQGTLAPPSPHHEPSPLDAVTDVWQIRATQDGEDLMIYFTDPQMAAELGTINPGTLATFTALEMAPDALGASRSRRAAYATRVEIHRPADTSP